VKLHLENLRRGDYIALAGGFLLAISVFVKAYEARPENPNANIDGKHGTVPVWESQPLLRILLLLAALAPFILAWIVIREHELSWSRGEVTAVVGIAAVGLIFYSGVIDRPGEPPSEIELEIGWYGLLLGAILMIVGATMRSTETERTRKPPGVL
jgi:hypothetical protein